MNTEQIILDDGTFYVDLNVNYPAEAAPGFLLRRCPVGLTTPGGYECVGSFCQVGNGLWRADVNAPYDPETDSDCLGLGEFKDRKDAIVALWHGRRYAYTRH